VAVPSRIAAAAILLSLDPPAWLVGHVATVAEIAAFLAERTAARGVAVDRGIVEAAALLHDIDKLLPEDDPVQELGHGDAGARWLTQLGYGELARAVAAHPVTRLLDADRYGRWNGVATREERIVAYADKRAGQRLESMKSRFAGWESRYPQHREGLARGRARAERLERQVCETAGVSPLAIRRLRWVAPAIESARREMAAARADADPSGDGVAGEVADAMRRVTAARERAAAEAAAARPPAGTAASPTGAPARRQP
jgi:putative nucleotidyltransferase with HDIG domain